MVSDSATHCIRLRWFARLLEGKDMLTLFFAGFAAGIFGTLAALLLAGWWLERRRKRRIWRVIEAELRQRRNGARVIQ